MNLKVIVLGCIAHISIYGCIANHFVYGFDKDIEYDDNHHRAKHNAPLPTLIIQSKENVFRYYFSV